MRRDGGLRTSREGNSYFMPLENASAAVSKTETDPAPWTCGCGAGDTGPCCPGGVGRPAVAVKEDADDLLGVAWAATAS